MADDRENEEVPEPAEEAPGAEPEQKPASSSGEGWVTVVGSPAASAGSPAPPEPEPAPRPPETFTFDSPSSASVAATEVIKPLESTGSSARTAPISTSETPAGGSGFSLSDPNTQRTLAIVVGAIFLVCCGCSCIAVVLSLMGGN